ncbi:MAG: Rossmann-like and DUF2520 domain-containing protein, partial [Mangrovibacterium sp.]
FADMIQRITFIGAGNLATSLASTFFSHGLCIRQVYSRTAESARKLARLVNASYTCNPEEIDRTADLLVVALKDDAIVPVLSRMKPTDRILVHTAGSVPMEKLASFSKCYGVFYPLQTFSRTREVDFSDIPLCLEASSGEVMSRLMHLGRSISSNVLEMDSMKRKILHLAAVWGCNFVNHLYYMGQRLLEENELSFDLLKPLIRETAAKIEDMSPLDAQTGPAVRNDSHIIGSHLQLMDGRPGMQEIYRLMTESVYRTYKKQTR